MYVCGGGGHEVKNIYSLNVLRHLDKLQPKQKHIVWAKSQKPLVTNMSSCQLLGKIW